MRQKYVFGVLGTAERNIERERERERENQVGIVLDDIDFNVNLVMVVVVLTAFDSPCGCRGTRTYAHKDSSGRLLNH